MSYIHKDVLYLGTLIPDSEFNKILNIDNTPQTATYLFSWKIFLSIINCNSDNFYIISTRPVSDYPNCKLKLNQRKSWQFKGFIINEIFFINLPVLKTITLTFSSLIYSFKWILKTKNSNRRFIFLDNYQLPYLLTGYLISILCKIPFVCVLTDPPNMNYKISWEPNIKKFFRILNGQLTNLLLHKLHGVIATTNYLAHEFCPKSKHLIIEAIGEGNENVSNKKFNKFVITYTGGVSMKYGIKILLEAFVDIKYKDLELWFYGKGDAESLIIQFSKLDSRIKFKGYSNNDVIKKIQTEVSLLINPRPIDLPDGKYSFPSKILEYMESGTPALVTKLKGIPKEYDDYLIYIDPLSKEELISKIEQLYFMDKQKLLTLGNNAKIFARTKNIINQGEKINQFLNLISKNH